MKFFCFTTTAGLLLCSLLNVTSPVHAAAIDEVNLFRTTHGLHPFKHDPQLSVFAQRKAEYRAIRLLKNGHQGPQNPPGTAEGTAEALPMWGWLSCAMEEDWEYAGAGVAIGADHERYMVLVVRNGSGAALKGRSLRPVSTAHLTPNPPSFDRSGNRTGGGATIARSLADASPKTRATASKTLQVGQRDKDGALIIKVGR